MKKPILKKITNSSGESIAETLVALLIAALALVMLASMISSTTSIVTQSKATMKSYYDNNNLIAKQETTGNPATITLAPNGATGDSKQYSVSVYVNNTLGNTPVVSYRVPTPTSTPSPTPSGGS